MRIINTIVKQSLAWFAVVAMLATLIQETKAAPRPVWLDFDNGIFKENSTCENDVRLMELCQRCAKLTKSRLAYPECCSPTIMARKWCSDYVYFGNDK